MLLPPVKLSTIGGRAFAVSAPHIWNGPPDDVISADSLLTFRRLLKLLFISTIVFNFLVHGLVTIIFVVSVCLSVCLFVCAEFSSAVFDPIWIKLGHMLHVQV